MSARISSRVELHDLVEQAVPERFLEQCVHRSKATSPLARADTRPAPERRRPAPREPAQTAPAASART